MSQDFEKFALEMESYNSDVPKRICAFCYSWDNNVTPALFKDGDYLPGCSEDHTRILRMATRMESAYYYYNKDKVINMKRVWMS